MSLLEYIGHHLVVHFTIVKRNRDTYSATVELTNAGSQSISGRAWKIVLCYRYKTKPRKFSRLAGGKFVLQHLEAELYRLIPGVRFRGLSSGETVKLAMGTIYSSGGIFPNWSVYEDIELLNLHFAPGILFSVLFKKSEKKQTTKVDIVTVKIFYRATLFWA